MSSKATGYGVRGPPPAAVNHNGAVTVTPQAPRREQRASSQAEPSRSLSDSSDEECADEEQPSRRPTHVSPTMRRGSSESVPAPSPSPSLTARQGVVPRPARTNRHGTGAVSARQQALNSINRMPDMITNAVDNMSKFREATASRMIDSMDRHMDRLVSVLCVIAGGAAVPLPAAAPATSSEAQDLLS